jgi:hypothetical protein
MTCILKKIAKVTKSSKLRSLVYIHFYMGFLHKDGFSPIILVTLHIRIIDNIIYVLPEAILKY